VPGGAPKLEEARVDRWLLHDVRVLDETGGFTEPADVSVVDGVVAAVGRGLRDDEATVADLAGSWLMPGVFDCHAHITIGSVDTLQMLRTPVTQWALGAAKIMRQTLAGGVTSARDAGGADAGIRAAVELGYVAGPRLQVSVVPISQTGGHFDGFLQGPGLDISAEYICPEYPGRPGYLVDGVDEMRRTVRQVIRAGADWVKIATTGGVLSPYSSSDAPEFSYDEVATAVTEAARRNKPVMSHAFGGPGLANAVRAGVRSIEHGIFLDEENAALMAGKGTWLVPTLVVWRDTIALAESGDLPEHGIRKALDLKTRIGTAVQIAKAHQVKIALGCDYYLFSKHGRNLEEISLLHQAGLTVEEALLAATWNGAQLCGVSERLGRIAPGYVFDAIVLDQDPGDPSVFERPGTVTGVFKAGVPVVPHPRLAAARLRASQPPR
jgi:imidazolonepropionase-like amidohydrolase